MIYSQESSFHIYDNYWLIKIYMSHDVFVGTLLWGLCYITESPIVCMTQLTLKLFHWNFFRIIFWIDSLDWWDEMWKLMVWRRTSSVRSCSLLVWIKLQLQLQTNREITEGQAVPLSLSLSDRDGQRWEGSQYFRWGLPWHPRRRQVSLGRGGNSFIISVNLRGSAAQPCQGKPKPMANNQHWPNPFRCLHRHLLPPPDMRSVLHKKTKK